jgi:hypothetical protein
VNSKVIEPKLEEWKIGRMEDEIQSFSLPHFHISPIPEGISDRCLVKVCHELPGRRGDLGDGPVEGSLVCPGGRAVPADLAHELQGSQVDFLFGGDYLGTAKTFNISAHG